MKHYKCPECGKYTIVLDLEHKKYRCRSRDCLFVILETEKFIKKIKSKEEQSVNPQAIQAPA